MIPGAPECCNRGMGSALSPLSLNPKEKASDDGEDAGCLQSLRFRPGGNRWAADAKSNWDDNCAKCHGADGKGDTKMGHKLDIKDFTDAKVQAPVHRRPGLQSRQGWLEGRRPAKPG